MATYTDNYSLTKPTFAEVADIRTINGNMDTIDDIMHASQVSLADAYDQTATYNTGDVVMYEFLMYKCKEDNVTGNWDATKWERTTAAETGGEASDLSVKVPEVISTGDKACYVKRAIPTAGALAEGQKIVGATLAWNQLVQNGNFVSTSGWNTNTSYGSIATSSNVLTYTIINTSPSFWHNQVSTNIVVPSNHKALIKLKVKPKYSNKVGVYGDNNMSTSASKEFNNLTANEWNELSCIFTINGGITRLIVIFDTSSNYAVNDTIQIQVVNAIDLTQLFGSTIADTIYQMEQTTAGSGVAFFRKYFPEDYYDYESGKLESVNVSAHRTYTSNIWDETWEVGGYNTSTGEKDSTTNKIRSMSYIDIIPDTEYLIANEANVNIRYFWYDSNHNYISNSVINNGIVTSPSNAYYMTFQVAQSYGTTYLNDISINQVSSITLDSSKEFRGLYQLASGELRADGDIYEADGTVTRKYGKITYDGSEGWSSPINNRFYFESIPTGMDNTYGNKRLSISNYCAYNDSSSAIGYYFAFGSAGIYINRISSEETLAEFKQRLSEHPLEVQYIITPTTESATPYTNPQLVDADGTEEFVDYKVSQGNRDVAIPVGHESSFYDYTDGTITIPDLPFADGTYALSVTMNNGTPTFSWEGGN